MPTLFPIPSTGLRLSEVLPVPDKADWNGDGRVDANDEWIEIYNAGPNAVALGGWMLDDGRGDTAPYRFGQRAILPAYSYLVLYRSATGINLNNRGDQVRLLNPRGQLVDSVTFSFLGGDASYSRDVTGVWHVDWSPTPGRANVAPLLTPWPNHGRPVPN